MPSLKHAFECLIPDDPAEAVAGNIMWQRDWGAEHLLTQASARILGRITAGTGATEELTAAQVAAFVVASFDAAALKAAILSALGISAWVITDTTLTISRIGADLVTRQTIIDLEVPV